jgi:hypothetical protein
VYGSNLHESCYFDIMQALNPIQTLMHLEQVKSVLHSIAKTDEVITKVGGLYPSKPVLHERCASILGLEAYLWFAVHPLQCSDFALVC